MFSRKNEAGGLSVKLNSLKQKSDNIDQTVSCLRYYYTLLARHRSVHTPWNSFEYAKKDMPLLPIAVLTTNMAIRIIMIGTTMKQIDLKGMSTDELWALHEKIAAKLAAKLEAEKSVLENRLEQLNRQCMMEKSSRRSYPVIFPKFRNPDQPSQTWAGRGRQPRWLAAQLKSGKRIDYFRIDSVAA